LKPRAALGFAAAAVVLLLLILPGQLRPDHFFQDDSYFYLQVAAKLAAGQGSTFHGITPTNGYHPLWMPFCVLAQWLADGDRLVGMRLVTLVQILLFLGTLLCFRRGAALAGTRRWWVGAAPLGAFFLGTTLHGSEAHLNAFMQCAAVVSLLSAASQDRATPWVRTGLLLGFAVLARLDNIFVVGWLLVFGTMGLIGRRVRIRRLLLAGVSTTLVVLPYLIHNRVVFGHIMPISGAVKSTFPHVEFDPGGLGGMGRLAVLFGLLALLISWGFDRRAPAAALLRALGCGTLTHAAWVVLFTRQHTNWMWYYVTGVLALAFGLALGFELASRRVAATGLRRALPVVRFACAASILAAGTSYAWVKAYPERIPIRAVRELTSFRWPARVAVWMRDNLAPDSRLLVYDFPGTLAYYSGLSVLPTDGLINDYDYNADLLRLGINRYLCEKRVGYYFGHLLDEDTEIGPGRELRVRVPRPGLQEIEVLTPLDRQSAGVLRVDDADLVVRIREIVDQPERTPPLAFWRIDPCGAAAVESVGTLSDDAARP